MIRIDRSVLVESAFKLGACAESLAHPLEKGTLHVQFVPEQIENVRAALLSVMTLLSKESA